MVMFSSAKIGDKVWSWCNGWGVITKIDYNRTYPLVVMFDDGHYGTFNLEGKVYEGDLNPSLFWDEIKLEIPKKEFNLKAEYSKLIRKDFVHGETNYFIAYDCDQNLWEWDYMRCYKELGTIYFEEDFVKDFISLMNENKVTPKQFDEMLKEVINEEHE